MSHQGHVVVAAEFCRVDSPWPEKIRVRSGYVDPTVMETAPRSSFKLFSNTSANGRDVSKEQ